MTDQYENPLPNIVEQLSQKIDLFLEYEKITQRLLECNTEELEDYILARDEIASRVDGINQALAECCSKSSDIYPLLTQAIQNQCNYGDLTEDLKPVFEKSQKVYGIITRIQTFNPQIVARVEAMRQEMLCQIACVNNSKTASMHKYLNSAGFKTENFSVLGGKYAKV